ncbi:GSCFA family protein [Ekhidna lutea]|uniref:GSCFA family protein n=1 Tax=Ekhidna lutea TaxID=447679 RepID=A0A239HFJ1_EKHLU|nr:GSCFA domain-containing protein [Ekhidna lutea]SNS79818.1 GSCFA family protein [Ekhidna lutea]
MFKIDFNIPESSTKINLKDSIFLIGSCFSNEIGKTLTENKLQSLSNPFGTIYNPYSIFNLLSNSAEANDVIESQSVFYHWDAHGEISGLSESETISVFEKRNKESQAFLKNCNWLIITLGTAIVYENQAGHIVANCHKVPAGNFKKRYLNQEEIISQYSSLHSYLNDINPDLKIVFTVSPVRHIRDGLVENNRSKAILIDAIHTITSQYKNTSYFPSYEIVVDELRDYRFFKTDRVHPTEEATEYVWNQFVQTYFDSETQDFLQEWNKLKAAIHHRPFQPESKSHQAFLKSTLEKLKKLNEKVDLSVEVAKVSQQLT